MSYLGKRPAIAAATVVRAGLLMVETRTEDFPDADGKVRFIVQRDVLSPFRAIRNVPSQVVPVSMDKRLAMIFEQIVEEQRWRIDRHLDYIEEHGWLAYDMSIGRVTG